MGLGGVWRTSWKQSRWDSGTEPIRPQQLEPQGPRERQRTVKERPPPGPQHPLGPSLSGSGSFSIFWITDTQFLSESNPALFRMVNELDCRPLGSITTGRW